MEPIFTIVYGLTMIISISINWKRIKKESRMARWFFIGLHGVSIIFFASLLWKIPLPPLFQSYNNTMSTMIRNLLP